MGQVGKPAGIKGVCPGHMKIENRNAGYPVLYDGCGHFNLED
jgi:hypothetical protein